MDRVPALPRAGVRRADHLRGGSRLVQRQAGVAAGRRDRARDRASSGRGRSCTRAPTASSTPPTTSPTADELHVKVNTIYHYKLESRDVLHSFSVPVFRLKQDAIPGRVISGWFEPTKTGIYDIQCVEMCGIGHALMPARIVIESAADHAAWMAKNAPPVATASAAAPPKYAVSAAAGTGHIMAEPAHDAPPHGAPGHDACARARRASPRRELLREVLLVDRPQDDRQAVPVHRACSWPRSAASSPTCSA